MTVSVFPRPIIDRRPVPGECLVPLKFQGLAQGARNRNPGWGFHRPTLACLRPSAAPQSPDSDGWVSAPSPPVRFCQLDSKPAKLGHEIYLNSRYHGHRNPTEIISHAVWLYYRFGLRLRDVEDLLAKREVVVFYETVRRWCGKFGPDDWLLDEATGNRGARLTACCQSQRNVRSAFGDIGKRRGWNGINFVQREKALDLFFVLHRARCCPLT